MRYAFYYACKLTELVNKRKSLKEIESEIERGEEGHVAAVRAPVCQHN